MGFPGAESTLGKGGLLGLGGSRIGRIRISRACSSAKRVEILLNFQKDIECQKKAGKAEGISRSPLDIGQSFPGALRKPCAKVRASSSEGWAARKRRVGGKIRTHGYPPGNPRGFSHKNGLREGGGFSRRAVSARRQGPGSAREGPRRKR